MELQLQTLRVVTGAGKNRRAQGSSGQLGGRAVSQTLGTGLQPLQKIFYIATASFKRVRKALLSPLKGMYKFLVWE